MCKMCLLVCKQPHFTQSRIGFDSVSGMYIELQNFVLFIIVCKAGCYLCPYTSIYVYICLCVSIYVCMHVYFYF